MRLFIDVCATLFVLMGILLTPSLSLAVTIRTSTNDAAAINAVLEAGGRVDLVKTVKPYIIDAPLVFAAHSSLHGEPGTIIEIGRLKTVFSIPRTAHDVEVQNIVFKGTQGSTVKPVSVCAAPEFRWNGGGMSHAGPLFLTQGCNGAVIENVTMQFSFVGAITVVGARSVSIVNSEFNNNLGFGVFATNGATHFMFDGNRSKANAIEAIAVGFEAHDGDISNNVISGAGDNCISISGDNITAEANQVSNCLGAGIAVYGDHNHILHNIIENNGQVHNPSAPPIALWNGTYKQVYKSPGYDWQAQDGIAIAGAVGGYGQRNIIEHNLIIDTQVPPTQNGIKIVTGTPLWTPGFVQIGTYMFSNGSTYMATSGGNSLKAPSGTGTYHDGAVDWEWCSRPTLSTRQASGNTIQDNSIKNFAEYSIKDFSKLSNNDVRDNTIQSSRSP